MHRATSAGLPRARTLRTSAAITTAVVALGGLALSTAPPSGAYVGGTGSGGIPQTDGPDLLSVTLLSDNALGDQMRADYCFDQSIQGTPAATSFYIKTYDADRFLRGLTTNVVPDSSLKCWRISFNPTLDLKTQGSIGEVDEAAVTGDSGRKNYFSSAPLTGSTLSIPAGKTTGPDLEAATTDASNNTVTYRFDQQIMDEDPATAALEINAGRFGVVSDDGKETVGTSAVLVNDGSINKVRVTFPSTEPVTSKIRFFNRAGAVRTKKQDGITGGVGPAVSCPLAAESATACFSTPSSEGVVSVADGGRPLLLSATPVSGVSTQFLLTYNKDLSSTRVGSRIIAVLDNGNTEAAVTTTYVSATSFYANFDANGLVSKEPGAVVKIVSQTGAVNDPSITTPDPADDAPISSINVGSGTGARPGLTTAPDLLRTSVVEGAPARFIYDEPVDNTASISGSAFRLLVQNGTPLTTGTFSAVSDDRREVLISFGTSTSAVGVGNGQGAVRDKLGNPAPYSSVSTQSGSGGGGGGPVAGGDAITVARGASGTVNVLTNDTFTGTPTVTMSPLPGGVTATVSGGNVTVSVAATYTGGSSVALGYTLTDSSGSAAGSIALTVPTAGTAPVAQDDSTTITKGQSVVVDVLANDTFVGTPTVAASAPPAGVEVAVLSDNRLRITVLSSYSGGSITTAGYTLTDGGGSDTAQVSVSVVDPGPTTMASSTRITAPGKVKKGNTASITVTVNRGSASATGTVTIKVGTKTFTKTLSGGRATVKVKITKKTAVTASYKGNATTLASSAKATIGLK